MNIDIIEKEREINMLQIIRTQCELKIEINKFKERGESEFKMELMQLHVLEIFSPVDATKLTNKHRAKAVASVMFLKEKWN